MAAEAMTQEQTIFEQDRAHLNFQSAVREKFAFLNDLGFSEIEALPTLVRYRKDDVEVDVYYGRQSYEIGAGISYLGARYEMADIIRAMDADAAERYGGAMASRMEGVVAGLEELGSLIKRHGVAALRADPQFFSTLEEKREIWRKDYWLDGLARQLRPQADDAFHRGDYSRAAELYARIRDRLSPAEIKKLTFAEQRSQCWRPGSAG
ncbi:hypothetical protein [Candidatus Accumulibacter aalborgensis]|uniref:hypothetical protein n=1 Tax=Candidatus Accumulibacter aalborgensis TaxID=1860102 RepID=UPI0016485883|nr:hypothetical protein [Candidatus Accumulibacter aalborgensis]